MNTYTSDSKSIYFSLFCLELNGCFDCTECDYAGQYVMVGKRHKNIHTGYSKCVLYCSLLYLRLNMCFACTECVYASQYIMLVKRSMNTHTGNSKFVLYFILLC